MERQSGDILSLLDEAAGYLSRGEFLAEEDHLYFYGRRARVARARRGCLLAQARVYGQRGWLRRGEALLSSLLEENALDEDALCALMLNLQQQGRTSEGLRLYEETKGLLEREGLTPTEATRATEQRLRNKPSSALLSGTSTSNHASGDSIVLSPFTTAISQGIISTVRELGKEEIYPLFTSNSHRVQRKASLDIPAYKRNIRLALYLHRTSTAQELLQDVNADIQDLGRLELQARGHDLYYVKEILIANNLLAVKIVKDQRQYEPAYRYANYAVRVAKSLEDGDLIATAKYTRGCVKLEWAQFGTVKQGILQLNKEKVQDAIHDFQDVLNMAHIQHTPLHPQLLGFTRLQLGRAYSLLHDIRDGSAETNPLIFVERAESMVGSDSIEDAYTRLVITGTVSGLHWGAYHLNKAEVFIAMGMQDQALPELKHLRLLTERTYAQDETRNQAWSNVVMAEVLMQMEAYPEATSTLKSALLACRSINSIQNTATIIDIHSRLTISSYGTSADVQEIAAMLKEWYE